MVNLKQMDIMKILIDDSMAISLIGILTILIFFMVSSSRKKNKFPPGPIGLPFVGYLPFLGKVPHVTLWELSKKYGQIISLRLGSKLNVILSDYESAKEGLSHSAALGRAGFILKNLGSLGFGTANGEEWVEQRRFSIKAMRNLGLGRGSWEKLIREGVTPFLEDLSKTHGQPYDVAHSLCTAIIYNIFSLLIGRKFQDDTEMDKINLIIKYTEVSFTYNGPSNIASIVPGVRKFLEYFDIAGYDTAKEIISDFCTMISDEVQTHYVGSPSNEGDFIQLYIEKMNEEIKKNNEHYFSEHNLKGTVNGLFLGAGDTIFSSLTWLINLMAAHQDVQEKVHEELDEVIGRDGWMSYEERLKVPYTFAVVMEVERFASIVPLSTPRVATSDFELNGYTIPKGTCISANLWLLHNDPKYWHDPHVFKPERFLDSDGKLVTNMPSFAPFSLGRRNCPGETVAWMEILAFFTGIMQKFLIKPVPGQKVKFDVVYGLVTNLVPQKLCFVERK